MISIGWLGAFLAGMFLCVIFQWLAPLINFISWYRSRLNQIEADFLARESTALAELERRVKELESREFRREY